MSRRVPVGRAAAGPSPGATDPPAWLVPVADGVRLHVHAQPGARRSAIVGTHGDRLKIALQAPPVDGRANAALLALLARVLDLPARDLRVTAGASSREKTVHVACAAAAAATLAARLLPPGAP